jgi:hypothetical protein
MSSNEAAFKVGSCKATVKPGGITVLQTTADVMVIPNDRLHDMEKAIRKAIEYVNDLPDLPAAD